MLFKDIILKMKFDCDKLFMLMERGRLPRSAQLTGAFAGARVLVYNGRHRRSLLIKLGMERYNLGSFIFTRPIGYAIHQGKRKNRKKIKKVNAK